MSEAAEQLAARQAEHWAFQIEPRSLARIIRGAHSIASMASLRKPIWCVVMDLFCCGSTFANALCERAGIDPDCELRRIHHA
jgi:hypothetical protein